MKHFMYFLFLWVLVILTVFIICELIVAIEAIILSVRVAYEIATATYTIIIGLIFSAILTIVFGVVTRKRK